MWSDKNEPWCTEFTQLDAFVLDGMTVQCTKKTVRGLFGAGLLGAGFFWRRVFWRQIKKNKKLWRSMEKERKHEQDIYASPDH